MQEQSLKAAVLKTLVFFDIFNFPLTSLEIVKYLYGATGSLAEVEAAINSSSQIKTFEGFYFLSSRGEEIVAERKKRYNIAEIKFKKVKRVGWFLALLPYVRFLAVANTLAYSNAKAESDIDIFVVAKKGKVWTARFFCLLFLKIFGLRPVPGKSQNRFCLSFFVDEDHLDLRQITLPRDDIYLWYWITELYSVYDSGNLAEELWQKNSWLKERLPQSQPVMPHPRRTIKPSWFWRAVKSAKELPWRWNGWESFFRKIQLKALPPILRQKLENKDVGVVISDGVIKLIANDRREAYRNEWVAKVSALIGGNGQ